MFDVGASELLLVVIVAIVVIGPKDLPLALRTAGRWIGKVRRISGHFRTGIETMIREAELAEMEKKWQDQNDKVMEEHPATDMSSLDPAPTPVPASAEARAKKPKPATPKPATDDPQLPLGGPPPPP